MSEQFPLFNNEALSTITPDQDYAWGLICAGLDYSYIAEQLGQDVAYVQEIVFGDNPESLASRLDINPEFYDPTTTVAILGYASGRYELPTPEVKATLYPELASPNGTFAHPEIAFGEAATPIAVNLCMGFNNATIAENTGRSYQKVKQYLSKFYRTKLGDLNTDDINPRTSLVVNMLASEAHYIPSGPTLMSDFIAIWRNQFIS